MGNTATIAPTASDPGNGHSIPKPYLGTYDRVVDKSGRVLLQSEWRAVGEKCFLVLVWPVVRNPEYLMVLPPSQTAKLYAKLGDLPLSDASGNDLARAVGAHSYEIELDDYGRLPIPEVAAKAVGITSKVTLVGGVTRFELWEPDRYKAFQARSEVIERIEKALETKTI